MSEICKEFTARGEWDNEPDKLEFTYKNYECSIRRNWLGALCGYVKAEIPEEVAPMLRAHGGITYTKPDEIGFDCAHCWDFAPKDADDSWRFEKGATYKNIDYVTKQCMRLVDQIAKHRSEIEKIGHAILDLNSAKHRLSTLLDKTYGYEPNDLGLGNILHLASKKDD